MTTQIVVVKRLASFKRRQVGPFRARLSQTKPIRAHSQGVRLPEKRKEPRYAEFGRRLKYFMALAKIQPGDLKRRMDVADASTVSRWRRGTAKPEGVDLLRLAGVLGVEVNQIDPGFAPPGAQTSLDPRITPALEGFPGVDAIAADLEKLSSRRLTTRDAAAEDARFVAASLIMDRLAGRSFMPVSEAIHYLAAVTDAAAGRPIKLPPESETSAP